MVDPRILPCAKSLCNRCIDFWTDQDIEKEVKCQLCNKIHETPNEGFPINITLQEMLVLKAKEVLQSK